MSGLAWTMERRIRECLPGLAPRGIRAAKDGTRALIEPAEYQSLRTTAVLRAAGFDVTEDAQRGLLLVTPGEDRAVRLT